MKNLITKARENLLRAAVTVKGIVSDRRGSGMIDLAILPVQVNRDRTNNIQNCISGRIVKAIENINNIALNLMRRGRIILADKSGQGALDQVVSILISIILGSLLLAGLYMLFSNTVLPAIQEKIMDIFNYAG